MWDQRRTRRRLFRALAAGLALSACRSKPPPAAPPPVDAATEAQAAAPGSPFVIVARAAESQRLGLRRAHGGPAFVVTDSVPGALLELGADGTMTPYRRVASDVNGVLGAIGLAPEGVTEMEVEQWTGSSSTTGAVVGVAGSSIHRSVEGERRVGWYPWRDESVLVLRSDTTTSMVTSFPWIHFHQARLEALTAVGKPAPKVPAMPPRLVHADRFVAYPSGRVLVLGAIKDDQIPPSWFQRGLYDLAEPDRPIDLPKGFDITDALLAGKQESELLVAGDDARKEGKPSLAAFDPEKRSLLRIDVTGTELPFKSVTRTDDGELWFATGWLNEGVGQSYGKLYRGRVKDGRLEATRVLLPACPPDAKVKCKEMTPLHVVAHGHDDVWAVAQEDDKDPDFGDDYLLHLQPRAPASVAVIDPRKLEDEAWAELPPRPYKIRCRNPLLILGASEAVTEAQITETARTMKVDVGYPSSAERGRVGGQEVWALRLGAWSDQTPDPNARLVQRWKKAIATTKIVCAGLLTNEELPLKYVE